MTLKIDNDGQEIEVWTAEEVAAREAAAKESVSTELNTKLTEAEKEKARLEGLLSERAGEFKQFRKLTEEQEGKLSKSEREKYEIQKQLNEANESINSLKTEREQDRIDAVIRAQCGNDKALFDKTKDMYAKINLPASTPEEIAARVRAAFGAIAPSEPNVAAFLASTAGNGHYQPPQALNAQNAPDPRIVQGAKELGLKI